MPARRFSAPPVRQPGRPKVRVFNPTIDEHGWKSHYTIVETVTDDSPFLVDSISMQISALGHVVVSNTHPILRVERDAQGELRAIDVADAGTGRAESWMQIAIPRIVEETALRDIKSRLIATLSDVRLAVRDWQILASPVCHTNRRRLWGPFSIWPRSRQI